MKTRNRILFATVVIALIGTFTWLLLRPTEPSYQGKPLTFWLEQFADNHWTPRTNGELDKQAQVAIQHMGAQAIPIFLRMMAVKEPRFRMESTTLLPEQWLKKLHMADTVTYRNQLQRQRDLGAYGIISLGPQAQPAVPAIEKLLKDKSPGVRANAVFALRVLGPAASNAVPALIDCLNDSDPAVRFSAFGSLSDIHQCPDLVIPALIPYLNSQDRHSRLSALLSLREFGPSAKPVVPYLLGLLQDSNLEIRHTATNTLLAIDPEAAAKAGIKPP